MESSLYQDFGRYEDDHWWFRGRKAIVRDFLRAWLPPAERRRILDVGCGTGGMARMLTELGEVTGLESSDAALAFARERAGGAVQLVHGALPDGLPPGELFDLVTAFDVIEHIDDVVSALRHMRAVVKPRGALVVTVPAYMFLWSHIDEENHHFRRYSDTLLRAHLEAADFAVERMSHYNTLLLPAIAGVRLGQRLFPRRPGTSDFSMPPAPVNRVLDALFSSERFVVSRTRLPAGVSIIALARPA